MTTDKITVNSNGTSNTQVPAIQYGWKCPSCGAIMAPWQSTCVNCRGGSNIPYPNYPPVTYEPAPWWINPAYKWDITCGPSTTGSPLKSSDITTAKTSVDPNSIVTTWNAAPSTQTSIQNKLKVSLKSAGINI